MYPLTPLEARRLHEQLREGRAVSVSQAPRAMTPPPPLEEQIIGPVTGTFPRLCNRGNVITNSEHCCSIDFSPSGYWVFEPSVNSMYANFKVGVRSRSKDRAGYITGVLQEDHSECTPAHDCCRVTVQLVWGRSETATSVLASDIEPCRPSKKNSTVVQIRGLNGAPARTLIAKGVPRVREQPITVCEPGKERSLMYLPASFLTTLEPA